MACASRSRWRQARDGVVEDAARTRQRPGGCVADEESTVAPQLLVRPDPGVNTVHLRRGGLQRRSKRPQRYQYVRNDRSQVLAQWDLGCFVVQLRGADRAQCGRDIPSMFAVSSRSGVGSPDADVSGTRGRSSSKLRMADTEYPSRRPTIRWQCWIGAPPLRAQR